eukprot:6177260-Pleurochrysis_carterae.AAC.1
MPCPSGLKSGPTYTYPSMHCTAPQACVALAANMKASLQRYCNALMRVYINALHTAHMQQCERAFAP